MKYFLTFLALGVGVVIGAIAIVLGEGDDSPGLQGLGALVVVGMVALGVRTARQKAQGSARAMLVAQEHEEDRRKND